jgi:hypothetical protein
MMLVTSFAGIFFIKTSNANPTTIYVHPGESIQAAINAANPCDTIHVYNGTYLEQINVTKFIVLEGQNNIGTIVIGGFNVSKNHTTIKNFNITGGYEWSLDGDGVNDSFRAGIYSSSSYNIFVNNNIWNITGKNGAPGEMNIQAGDGGIGAGIYLYSSNGNNISFNSISASLFNIEPICIREICLSCAKNCSLLPHIFNFFSISPYPKPFSSIALALNILRK